MHQIKIKDEVCLSHLTHLNALEVDMCSIQRDGAATAHT